MALTFWLLTILLAAQNPKPLPELKPFLTEVRKKLHTDNLLLSQYTYTEKRTVVHFDSNQKPVNTEVNVFDIFPGSISEFQGRTPISSQPLCSRNFGVRP